MQNSGFAHHDKLKLKRNLHTFLSVIMGELDIEDCMILEKIITFSLGNFGQLLATVD